MERQPIVSMNYQALRTRTMTRFATALCIAALPLSAWVSTEASATGATELGLWIDDTGDGAVDIAPCGNKLCGRIYWLRAPLDKKGKPLTDDLNPSAAKRSQPVCGLQVLGALQRQGDGSYDAGWVYDPKVGEAYDAAIQLKDANHLVLTGYKGMKLFGKKFIWTRAPVDKPLTKCGGPPVPAAAPAAPKATGPKGM
jgi:uncharacterized protein (DUF2147 family)